MGEQSFPCVKRKKSGNPENKTEIERRRQMAEFTHFKKDGSAVMVDVHEKPDTYRAASATGTIQVSPEVFAAVRDHTAKKGDVLGVYVGHDHKNSYVGKVGNIDVGFTQSAGFNVYGNGKQRGVRCFVLDENDPRNYKTYTKTYEQLCDGKLNTPIKDAIWRVVPTTVDMAKPMIAKALAALAAAVALIVIAVKFL